ncbi:SMP-30/gluconolactonase/LRE family protein [Geomonas oryzisoli]|uniref:SMP-30/gluconolactonase/LRE family protein n=1 Tax=Geomonas oryzisoli TaxID=2847992 RepID=A0ABX8J4I5_9BACT|nr:6-bladed beta-propeller [Geomonas oryzisoli]QWV92474.1 SMP-30/gluconolactonase/LRE family protein [Geomonas oryzisoli]
MRSHRNSWGRGNSRLRLLRGALGMCLMFFLAGCAAPVVPLLQRGDAAAPQWPEPPMRAKIRWVKSIVTPRDAGIARSSWKHALEFFTGAEAENIVKPHGVYFDDAGRLFVADAGVGVVHLFDTKNGVYKRITGPSGVPFRSPIGLAQDETGGLYITDSAADAVYRYDLASGAVIPFCREMARPTGIAYNKLNKLLYISETGYGRVVALDRNARQKLTIHNSKGGEGLFNKPVDLAIDRAGRLYVNDPLNYKINVFSPDGKLQQRFGQMGDAPGQMDKAKGIAVDPEGRIFVCDSLLDTVQLFDASGVYMFSFGAKGTGAGDFWMPSGIHIAKNWVFVSDTYNNRVQVFQILSDEDPADDEPAAQQTGKR